MCLEWKICILVHLRPLGSMSWGKFELCTLRCYARQSRVMYAKTWFSVSSPPCHLPSIGPKQLWAIVNQGCARDAGTVHCSSAKLRINKACLYSKFPLFKTSWWMLRVLPQLSPLESSLPYLRAFQLGTVWPCTLRVIKNMAAQSQKF